MKKVLARGILLLSISLTLVAQLGNRQALAGGSGTGGGNLEEIDFKYRSTALEKILTEHATDAYRILGADPAKLVQAIRSTKAECSKTDAIKKTMTKENKFFWFDYPSNTVYLDCSRYFSAVTSNPASIVNGLIIHEYARSAEGETSDYRYSRKSDVLFSELAKIDPDVSASIPERFANIFSVGLKTADYVKQITPQLEAYYNLPDPDRAFCFTPKSTWPNFLHPLRTWLDGGLGNNVQPVSGAQLDNSWSAEYFKNSSDPRCAQYKLENVKNDPELMAEVSKEVQQNELDGGYLVRVPEIRWDLQKKNRIKNEYMPELKKVVDDSKLQLADIAKNSKRTPVERALAIAVKNILDRTPTEKFLGEYGFAGRDEVKNYENRINYLAFVAGKWLHDTGGDLTVYREFDLEVRVDELDKKVDYAIQLATTALAEAQEDKRLIEIGDKNNMIRSAAFWAIAGRIAWTYLVVE